MRCLVALLCIVAAGCGPGSRGSVRIDPALAALVPHDAVFLAGVRLDALRATPVYQKSLAQRPLPGVEEVARRTGIDPRRDLQELLVVSDGAHTVTLARGKFAAQGKEPRIALPGATRTPYKGYTLIGNEESAAAFLDASVAVVGRPAAVRAIIDGRGRSSGVPRALQDKVDDAPAASQIWAVATGGLEQLAGAAPQTGVYANLPRIFSALQSATAWADLHSGLKLRVIASCRTERDARTLTDALRGLAGLGRLATAQNRPDLLRIYDAIQVEQEESAINVSVDLTPEAFDEAAASLLEPPQRER